MGRAGSQGGLSVNKALMTSSPDNSQPCQLCTPEVPGLTVPETSQAPPLTPSLARPGGTGATTASCPHPLSSAPGGGSQLFHLVPSLLRAPGSGACRLKSKLLPPTQPAHPLPPPGLEPPVTSSVDTPSTCPSPSPLTPALLPLEPGRRGAWGSRSLADSPSPRPGPSLLRPGTGLLLMGH